jgi:hypothetical protein
MNKILSLCTAIAALAFLSVTPAFAKKAAAAPAPSASTSPAQAESSPAKSHPFHGMVASVDAKAKTFTISSKKDNSRVFKISDQTTITKTGNPATMKDIAENQEVRGSCWKQADGSLVVRSIKLAPFTEQERAAEETHKARRAERKAAKAAAGASAAASASPAASATPKP